MRCVVVIFAALSAVQAAEPGAPTWSHDIASIIYGNCVECHRPGGDAPFSLLTFTEAGKRARMIARVTQSRSMPPWLPSGPRGVFVGERGLSETDRAAVAAWAAAGAPEGDSAEPPAPRLFDGDWRLGPPDVVVKMPRAYAVAPGPGDTYRAFVIPLAANTIPRAVRERAQVPDSNLLGVTAIDIHPGNRRVVHHVLAWVDTTGEARRREAESRDGVGYEAFGNPGFGNPILLGGRVPGLTPRRLPPGIADVYPLGGDIVLQVHYQSSGKPETDQTEIGLYFTREPIKRTVAWLRLGSFNLEIPAGAAAYTVVDELEIPADCFVLSLMPHMHLIGREVSARAIFPGGTELELLTIPHWDFAWQDRYTFKKPLYLPRGTKIRVRWVYDNSASNPHNPFSPPRAVHFGPNTADEMCEFHLFVVPCSLDDYEAFAAAMKKEMQEKIDELTPEQRIRYGFDAK